MTHDPSRLNGARTSLFVCLSGETNGGPEMSNRLMCSVCRKVQYCNSRKDTSSYIEIKECENEWTKKTSIVGQNLTLI